jgi:opacity protein-like surface antigen
MARSAQIQLLLISVLTARAALGQRPPQGPQNSDLSILGGPVIATQAIADANVPVHFNGVFSLQSNFAHTIHSYSFADLWLEFPSTSTFRGNDEVGGGIKSASFDATFGTPGVRLHVPVGRRVSFYGAVGAGYGRFDYNETGANGHTIKSEATYHGVFDFGGGMDFRLTRLLGVRGEVRDFVTGKGLGGVSGRNQIVFGFGMAVHF